MTDEQFEKLRYPIGKFNVSKIVDAQQLKHWIRELETLPEKLSALVNCFNDSQLDTPYRLGGWTVRQVVHHLADSHHHCYTRFKWALTEEQPIIKAYDEKKWALLEDQTAPISLSLNYLTALHIKIVYLLRALKSEEFELGFIHPAYGEKIVLKNMVGMYAWHGNHHFAHIKGLALREGWV